MRDESEFNRKDENRCVNASRLVILFPFRIDCASIVNHECG